MRFSDVLSAYLSNQRLYSKPRSVKSSELAVKRLTEVLGDPLVCEVDQKLIELYVQERQKTLSNKTINLDLAVVRAAFNYGARIGLIDEPPVKIRLLRVTNKRVVKLLTAEDLKELLRVAKGRIHGILLVAANTGFRTDEILHLRWSDIHWREALLTVTSKPGVWSSKNHQERAVYVSEDLLNWLQAWRGKTRSGGDNDWVFATRSGKVSSIYNTCRDVRKVFQRAGFYIPGQPCIHRIRHSVASRLLSNGASLECVRDILGHSSVVVTSRYLHTTSDEKKRAASLLQF